MQVLVTGGAGKVGKRLAGDLIGRGHGVKRFDVVEPDGSDAYIQGNLRSYADVEAAVKGMDAVCHLGAIPYDNSQPFELFETNIRGTFHVLEAAAQHGVKKVVFASSACAMCGYSNAKSWVPEYLPIDERHPCQADDMYGMSKEIGEILGRGFAHRYGMSVICLRLSGVSFDDSAVGPGDLKSANVTCSDVIQAFRASLESPVPYGVYFVSSRWHYTNVSGEREDPAVLARLIRESGAKRIDNSDGFLEGKGPFSIAKAERELGYDPQY